MASNYNGVTNKYGDTVHNNSSNVWPVMGFYFWVEIGDAKAKFQEVSGLEVQVETEEIKEGGRLDYTIRIPSRTKYGTLTLKRGVMASGSDLADWVTEVAFFPRSAGSLDKRNIRIGLMDENKNDVATWDVYDAYPTKYSVASLNATENAIAFETIEFAYREFSIVRS